MKENKEKILLASDFVGVGKVALSMMIPILSSMEADISYLPTAMISNNFSYGKVALEDLSGFMEDSLKVWKEHSFEFDLIFTGILLNTRQVNLIKDFKDSQKNKKALIISDPIMGDHGSIYPGLSPDIVEASKKVASISDLLIPNLTELSLILGEEYPDKLSQEILDDWLEKAKGLGIKSLLVTSVKLDGRYYVYGYGEDKKIFKIEYDHIDREVGGAGDVFASLLLAGLSKGKSLFEASQDTCRILSEIIREEYKDDKPRLVNEIAIEKHLARLMETN